MDDLLLNADSRHGPRAAGRTRDELTRRGLPHEGLSDGEATTLLLVWHGFSYTPTVVDERRVIATAWFISALRSGGRYRAQHLIDRPAYLDDSGGPVDCIVLMAVVQRHLLPQPRPGWDSETLSDELSVSVADLDRAQRALDSVVGVLKRSAPDRGSRQPEGPR